MTRCTLAHWPGPSSPLHFSARRHLHQRRGPRRNDDEAAPSRSRKSSYGRRASRQLCALCRLGDCVFRSGTPDGPGGGLRQGHGGHWRRQMERENHFDVGRGIHRAGGTDCELEASMVRGNERKVNQITAISYGFPRFRSRRLREASPSPFPPFPLPFSLFPNPESTERNVKTHFSICSELLAVE